MDYNTSRKKLILPEYGRNIQKMVDYLKTIEDRDHRNKMAFALVKVMIGIYPNMSQGEMAEIKRKVWDHLIIMADFDLDIDAPYPSPTREDFIRKPQQIPYPQSRIRLRHYGVVLEHTIEEAIQMDEGEKKDRLVEMIANQMKKVYLMWNRDSVNDASIINDLELLSRGRLKVPEKLRLGDYREMVPKKPKAKVKNKRQKRR